MTTIMQRISQLKEGFDDLESRLVAQGVTIEWHGFLNPDSEIKRIAFGGSLGKLMQFLSGERYDPSGSGELYAEKFRRLLDDFLQHRNDPGYALQIVQDGWSDLADLDRNYLRVGKMPNREYDPQLNEYRRKCQERDAEISSRVEQAKALLDSEDGKVFVYILFEYDKMKCNMCYGAGEHGTGQSGIGNVPCTACDGSGNSGYIPNINAEQGVIGSRVRGQLSNLGLDIDEFVPDEFEMRRRISGNMAALNPPRMEIPIYVRMPEIASGRS